MAIPDYQSIMLPLLRSASDGRERSIRETIEKLSEESGLTGEEKAKLLPSGLARTFDNRVGWARTYLKMAALIEYTKRGHFRITERGRKILSESPTEINVKFLERFPEFIEFRAKRQPGEPVERADGVQSETPEESLEDAYQKLREDVCGQILETILTDCSPSFFERIVIDLLVKMGYGGTRRRLVKPSVKAATKASMVSFVKTDSAWT